MRISLDIDLDDVLDELSDDDLRRELDLRRKRRGVKHVPEGEDAISERDAYQSLDDAAFALRQAGKLNLAYRLDEIRHDYFRTAG